MDILLCQLHPREGDPETNGTTVSSIAEKTEADLIVLPEMFLSGYGSLPNRTETENAVKRIEKTVEYTGKAIVLGTPHFHEGKVYNSLALLTPENTIWYDKIHLANFGMYSESVFTNGEHPTMGTFMGFRIGFGICYDIFFPELFRHYSLNGADVNICISASAVQSKLYFDTVLPSRALENVTYEVFVNNIGSINGMEMHGHSRGFDPLGQCIASCGDTECTSVMHVDLGYLKKCRELRRHLSDYRRDIDWFNRDC